MNRSTPKTPRVVVPNDDNTQKFITTRRYPIYYLAITKCASTYLKNVFYVLDNDALHPDPSRIHDYAHDLERADRTPRWMIRRSPFAFAVIRDPVSRFVSFYFDKIYRDGPQNFADLRLKLADRIGLELRNGLTAREHRQNCKLLIEWIARNLAHETEDAVNPHWRPQVARIRTVEHVKPTFLTVDGLDESLLRMLGPMIPNLADKLNVVRAQNRTRYPVSKDEVLDDALTARIRAIYHDDQDLYRRVKERHEMVRQRPARPVASGGHGVLTTHRFGLNAIVQPKAGSTYIRNLFYRLDHGVTHPDPANIDADNCLVYRQKSADRLAKEISFAVIRDPVERFFSLYFDKIWAEGENAFPWVSEALSHRRRFHAQANISAAEHHDNCCRLLGYIEIRFRKEEVENLNPHWRPQSLRLERFQDMGIAALTLDDCTRQISQVAGGRVRDLDEHLAALSFRNASTKPVNLDDLRSPWIMERLQHLYGDDIALFRRVRSEWAEGRVWPEL